MRSSSFWAVLCAATVCAAGPTAAVRGLMARVTRNSQHQHQRLSARDGAAAEPLECFQVQSPVLLPGEETAKTAACEAVLMDHHFANSYGQPFVGKYTPPKCNFNRVVMNFTVVSEGKQFDRLAVMYLGDTEVWRTSTAEPKTDPGIVWTYTKDMTPYLSLWKQPQTIIFGLGNIVNNVYTGVLNTTLTVTFINDDVQGPGAKPADQIVPLSARKGSQGAASAFTYPADNPTIPVTLPQNINRAVVSISANGQAEEEFWWSNVPDSSVNLFNSTTGPLAGDSSFREVQLYIDGQLAGLAWPFPVVFTGGVSPPLHRPLVGLDAFDLREQEVDITPWLGLLCDGKQHTFSFRIVGSNDVVVPTYWVLTGKIFLWLNDPKSITRGPAPTVKVTNPYFLASPPIHVGNGAYRYTQYITRLLSITSRITQNGKSTQSTWSQTFSMTNDGYLADEGNFQQVNAVYAGQDTATLNYRPSFQTTYSYPIDMVLNATGPNSQYSLRLVAQLYQGLEVTTYGPTVFSTGLEPFLHNLPASTPGYSLSTFRNSNGNYTQFSNGAPSTGIGNARQVFRRSAQDGPLLYARDVTVNSEGITNDDTYIYHTTPGYAPPPPAPQSKVLVEPSSTVSITSDNAIKFVPFPDKERGGLKVCFGKNIADQAKER